MTYRKWTGSLCVFLLCPLAAAAAPILRLHGNSLNPIWVQAGSNGPTTNFFEAYNIGDGTLSLQAQGNYSWLTPAVGAAAPCTFDAAKSCFPIKVLFSSQSLAAGVYSGLITISDANAWDSPQTVGVTIYVGGDVPASIDFYLPPTGGAQASATFQTPTGPPPTAKGSTQAGGNWLAVSTSGMGSFQFIYTHTVRATVQSGMAAQNFSGSVTISGSSFAADNKSVPVILHVTPDPIAQLSSTFLSLQAIEGAAALTQTVAVNNAGQGTLTLSGATASGGSWLSAAVQSDGTVQVKADPSALSPGFYLGNVAIASNAANSPVNLPVQFELDAVSAPLANFAGIVDAASFASGSPVGAGALASIFGSQLATGISGASSLPLPATLADAMVKVNGSPAPLIYASPGQINFQIPFEVSGTASVWVERKGQRGNIVTVQVAPKGPGIFELGLGYAAAQNATRSSGGAPVFALPDIAAFQAIPKGAARPNDILVLYGSGFGPVSPAVPDGVAAASLPLSHLIDTPTVAFRYGATFPAMATPQFVGLSPGFVGLYQLNVQVPAVVGANNQTQVQLFWKDGTSSNTVLIATE